ncbi:hypothetical protein PHYBLDRAFT_71660 [Phycomyces blakesleeanus NRRL 1555(-)]|uniref:Uncharacterized protein n=1 Tax=Phycomyces blakesleeanus (strain ATCC 8743b / DSM 1359 / FGSC 10004 / NBRC 33097 / NRRL 1555) TaxID=763407 RepID=A0A167JEA9_PHYB8|nr:hypothetical protein PHYBLDRAFT_71660 [Phycomyces blakesleeanus NRRL 1555(-)]OAD65819.1 hypothetical protein PHYBLDRAFT_71660 [Phycomyces blakesleeanus NRRL 1555(-)]|eukprot:XP_018283859.1 hypothetical protein PHYBLDRAFT_71660 [Phycomyces blakesleeanus NRRL 1555(-)]
MGVLSQIVRSNFKFKKQYYWIKIYKATNNYALKKSCKISEFIVKKKTPVESLSASTDELIKDILKVIEEKVNVKLEQIIAVKELEQTFKANKYINKVDNVLQDLESKERTLGFFESLG